MGFELFVQFIVQDYVVIFLDSEAAMSSTHIIARFYVRLFCAVFERILGLV